MDYNNNSLLNIRFGSLLSLRGLLLIYIRRKLYLTKPRNLSSRLLGLAYLAPIKRLRVTYSTLIPYFLTFLKTTTIIISL